MRYGLRYDFPPLTLLIIPVGVSFNVVFCQLSLILNPRFSLIGLAYSSSPRTEDRGWGWSPV